MFLYFYIFFKKHIDELSKKDNIDYNLDIDDMIEYLYDIPFDSRECMFETTQYAENYVVTIPDEYRVTSEELGLKTTHKEEDKCFDFWKMSVEEVNNKLSNIEIAYPAERLTGGEVQSLIIRDSEDNYKLMNITMFIDNDKMYVKDLFTGIDLFNVDMYDELGYEHIDYFRQKDGIDYAANYFINSIRRYASIE